MKKKQLHAMHNFKCFRFYSSPFEITKIYDCPNCYRFPLKFISSINDLHYSNDLICNYTRTIYSSIQTHTSFCLCDKMMTDAVINVLDESCVNYKKDFIKILFLNSLFSRSCGQRSDDNKFLYQNSLFDVNCVCVNFYYNTLLS